MASAKKVRANRRNGALGGRPRKPAPVRRPPEPPRRIAGTDIDGRRVANLARLGASHEAIVKTLRVPREYSQRADFTSGFDAEIAFGRAWLEIDLLSERRAHSIGNAPQGKVSATVAGLRNMGPNWDRVDKQGGAAPADLQGAISDAEKILAKYR